MESLSDMYGCADMVCAENTAARARIVFLIKFIENLIKFNWVHFSHSIYKTDMGKLEAPVV